MSVQRLQVDDVVLFHQNNDTTLQTLGSVRYIGLMYGADVMTQYVGIELLEPICNGHNGTINGYSYFAAEDGYGTHCKLRSVIKRLKASELFSLCKNKLKATKSNISNTNNNNNNNNNKKTNNITVNTPDSTTFDQRDSILTDFDGFAPKTPFSPRNSLLSQRKSVAQTKAIRMLKPRQSLSAALEFPDTEPVAAVIELNNKLNKQSEKQHSIEKERSKKRRKKSKKIHKHAKKHSKKKHKNRQPKIDRTTINNENERSKPSLVAQYKSKSHAHDRSKLKLSTHSKSASEFAHPNTIGIEQSKQKRRQHKHKIRRKNHKDKKNKNGIHYKSSSDTAHNNMKQFRIVEPMDALQNHLYLPEIPYTHQSHTHANSQQFENDNSHLYIPQQMQLTHSSSRSVPNIDYLEDINHNNHFQTQTHNAFVVPIPVFSNSNSGSNSHSLSMETEEQYSSRSVPVTPEKLVHFANNNNNNGQFNMNNGGGFKGYKQYLYEPIKDIESQLQSLQMHRNQINNYPFISNH